MGRWESVGEPVVRAFSKLMEAMGDCVPGAMSLQEKIDLVDRLSHIDLDAAERAMGTHRAYPGPTGGDYVVIGDPDGEGHWEVGYLQDIRTDGDSTKWRVTVEFADSCRRITIEEGVEILRRKGKLVPGAAYEDGRFPAPGYSGRMQW